MRCPVEDDPLYLGEALDRILFSDNTFTPDEQLKARQNEVFQRSPVDFFLEWNSRYLECIEQFCKENGEIADDSGLFLEGLGEKWFV